MHLLQTSSSWQEPTGYRTFGAGEIGYIFGSVCLCSLAILLRSVFSWYPGPHDVLGRCSYNCFEDTLNLRLNLVSLSYFALVPNICVSSVSEVNCFWSECIHNFLICLVILSTFPILFILLLTVVDEGFLVDAFVLTVVFKLAFTFLCHSEYTLTSSFLDRTNNIYQH